MGLSRCIITGFYGPKLAHLWLPNCRSRKVQIRILRGPRNSQFTSIPIESGSSCREREREREREKRPGGGVFIPYKSTIPHKSGQSIPFHSIPLYSSARSRWAEECSYPILQCSKPKQVSRIGGVHCGPACLGAPRGGNVGDHGAHCRDIDLVDTSCILEERFLQIADFGAPNRSPRGCPLGGLSSQGLPNAKLVGSISTHISRYRAH